MLKCSLRGANTCKDPFHPQPPNTPPKYVSSHSSHVFQNLKPSSHILAGSEGALNQQQHNLWPLGLLNVRLWKGWSIWDFSPVFIINQILKGVTSRHPGQRSLLARSSSTVLWILCKPKCTFSGKWSNKPWLYNDWEGLEKKAINLEDSTA